jgi:nucleoside-diphosphate-sugar epimerase
MSILVTGATGFIGRHLVQRLTGDERRIRALLLPGEDASTIEPLGVEIARGDVGDAEAVKRAAEDCELIFHLAAKTDASSPSRAAFDEVNVRGTANVARAALRAGASRLVFCSSGALYGRAIKNRSIDENTAPRPDSAYSTSKLMAERVLWSHHERDGLPVVVARAPAVFGPGAMRWLNLFRTIASGRFRLVGAGEGHHHVADVSDIVDGLARCGSAPRAVGRTYVIAAAESLPLRDLIQAIGEEVGVTRLPPSLPAAPFRLYDTLNRHVYAWTGGRLPRADRIDLYLGDRAFDISRSRRELGYAPQVTVREAVRRTATWFKAHGHL